MQERYATDEELAQSIAWGNRYVRDNIKPSAKPNYNATIRNELTANGLHAAKTLAAKLLNMSYQDAGDHVRMLQRTKPDDIVYSYPRS